MLGNLGKDGERLRADNGDIGLRPGLGPRKTLEPKLGIALGPGGGKRGKKFKGGPEVGE